MTEQNEIELLQSILDGWNYTPNPPLTKGMNNDQFIIDDRGIVNVINVNISNVPIPPKIGNFSQLSRLSINPPPVTPPPTSQCCPGTCCEPPVVTPGANGKIPSEIGNLGSLNFLDLGSNELTGEIPSEIGNLNNLVGLFLDGNNLSGYIPAEINSTNLPNLTRLMLRNNCSLQYSPESKVEQFCISLPYSGPNGYFCILCPPSLNLGDSLEESPNKKKPKPRMCYNSRTGCFKIVH